MHSQERLESQQCRTCYNSKSNLQLLKSLPDSWTSETEPKSYAELLREICDINVFQEVTPLGFWPQFICLACREKLKAAYDFIQETLKINRYLKSLAEQFQTNREHFIEIPELNIPLEIKRETDNDDVEYAVKERVIQDNPLEGEEEAIKVETLASPDSHLEREEEFKAENLAASNNECDESKNDRNKNSEDTNENISTLNLEINNNNTNFLCDKCNLILPNALNFKRHQKRHCPHCNLLCKRYCNLKNHIRRKHRAEKISDQNVPGVSKEKKISKEIIRVFKCKKCFYIFNTAQQLKRHNFRIHVPTESIFLCSQCGHKFEEYDEFQKHMLDEHAIDVVDGEMIEQIRCNKCDFKTIRRYRLHKHLKEMHRND